MEGKLVPERGWDGEFTGNQVCVSCNLWNCWHKRDEPCDITGCQCSFGHD